MKSLVSSAYYERVIMPLPEILTLLEFLDEQEFVVIERENPAYTKVKDYVQTTTNPDNDKLFWLEARQYHSDDLADFSHYRFECSDIAPIKNAFSNFYHQQENYQTWEDITAEFK